MSILKKYEILKKIGLDENLVNLIAVYFVTDYQIAKNKELLPLLNYKKPTEELFHQLVKFKRFSYIKLSFSFTNSKQMINKIRGLNDYDDQFIWLHERKQIQCKEKNYQYVIEKAKYGYKINQYLAEKRCKCWEGIKHKTDEIIKSYIKNNNSKGLKTYFEYKYNLYRPDWSEYLSLAKTYNCNEDIIDMIKMRM